jgi:biopolymer transport protein ExbD
MAFGSFGSGGNSQPMAEMNTTPLVDVMLVLLVIFIITAPLFHQAVQVDLPKVDSTRLEDKPAAIQLAIDSEGGIFFDGVSLPRSDLDARFVEAARVGATMPELHLSADRSTHYETVTDVMAAAQKAGIVKIAFVTEKVQR